MPIGFETALATPASEPPLEGDIPSTAADASTEAAVLIAVTDRAQPGVLLTLRRENLRTHAGQVAFPGGRLDPGRKCQSARRCVKPGKRYCSIPQQSIVVGALEPYRTVTGYRVVPVLGVIAPELPLEPHEHEVADLFEAPLGYLLDPTNQRRVSALLQGRERHYYEIDWNGRRIWGATAAMIVNLSRRLQWR